MINGTDIWTYKFADGTRLDCDSVAKGYGVTVEQLVNWNP
jgi:hypothetical protein